MFNEKTWRDGEKLAQNYMRKKGCKILYTNYSCAHVELDIVAEISVKSQERLLKKELKQKLAIENDLAKHRNLKQSYIAMINNLSPVLVITEVKARETDQFGTGAEAVSETKKRNIIKGAKCLLQKKEFEDHMVRFDVASVDGGVVNYIENAF